MIRCVRLIGTVAKAWLDWRTMNTIEHVGSAWSAAQHIVYGIGVSISYKYFGCHSRRLAKRAIKPLASSRSVSTANVVEAVQLDE